MVKFKIVHGSFKTPLGWFGHGAKNEDGSARDVMELDEKEAAKLDPAGTSLVLLSKWEIQQKGEAAKAKAIAEAEAEAVKVEPKKAGVK